MLYQENFCIITHNELGISIHTLITTIVGSLQLYFNIHCIHYSMPGKLQWYICFIKTIVIKYQKYMSSYILVSLLYEFISNLIFSTMFLNVTTFVVPIISFVFTFLWIKLTHILIYHTFHSAYHIHSSIYFLISVYISIFSYYLICSRYSYKLNWSLSRLFIKIYLQVYSLTRFLIFFIIMTTSLIETCDYVG